MKLAAHGVETDLPPGWEGRISLRHQPQASDRSRGTGAMGEVPKPVVHLANFALPENRGDFGSGAVDLMGSGDVLVVLFEYGPESVGKALFRRQGLPTQLRPQMFSRSALQQMVPGQAGCQIFFTAARRAFCLYAVLGRQPEAPALVPHANRTLQATRITAQ
jgi:hypothetical protein